MDINFFDVRRYNGQIIIISSYNLSKLELQLFCLYVLFREDSIQSFLFI